MGLFLVGLPIFNIETDHKPLLTLLKTKCLDELTPRIQRFRMRLMRFNYTIDYTEGKNLVTADTLSRAPVQASQYQNKEKGKHLEEKHIETFINTVFKSIPISDARLKQVHEEQEMDELISRVKNYVKRGWPSKCEEKELIKYSSIKHELTICNDILMYKCRIVIPKSMQKQILDSIHEGHQGIVKCRAFAKSTVWWPGISKDIQDKINECSICEKYREDKTEPLKPTETPEYPWQKVGSDLFEWEEKHYLIIVDYFSRWIEIAMLRNLSSKATIEHFKSIFARFGIPEVVVSDNGPQYDSYEFKLFEKNYGFHHHRTDPMRPQGNGEAERAVKRIKNLLRKSSDPYMALLNYRSTPL